MALESTNDWTIENLQHYFATLPGAETLTMALAVEFDLYKGDKFRTHVKYFDAPENFGNYGDDYTNRRRYEIDKAKDDWLKTQDALNG